MRRAHGLPVFEYAPRAIKLALVGSGAAEKSQVAHMIDACWGWSERIAPDASDALAVALCATRTLALRLHALAPALACRAPMIGSVRGRIASEDTRRSSLVEVGGVGYELEAPMSTFFHLPPVGEEVRLLTHLVVREDAHVLYGFGTRG